MIQERPIRVPLSMQVAQHLRARIARGDWGEALPTERVLSRGLLVSRTTLRGAIAILERDGVIRTDAQRVRRIVRRRGRHSGTHKRVVFLTRDVDIGGGNPRAARGIPQRVISFLERHRIECSMVYEGALSGDDDTLEPVLDSLCRRYQADCWILISMRGFAQRWFAERRLPAIAMGSVYPGLSMPHLDIDHCAVCRHAVGVLAARGHRRIGLLVSPTAQAEDIAVERGFREGLAAASAHDMQPRIIPTGRDPGELCRELDAAFASRAAPTALIADGSLLTLTAVSHCQQLGKRIPRDVSIISRGDLEALKYLRPAISRYEHNWDSYVLKLARMAQRLVTTGRLTARRNLIFPRWLEGESVAPPPA